MIYFIADTHFGHSNIIQYCNRPYKSVEEMDKDLITKWNNKVTNKDTVYILGDFCFRIKPNQAEEYLKVLKGKKILIRGNHDNSWITQELLDKYFEAVYDYHYFNDGNHNILLSHYPCLSYEHDKKAYMIHGHIHNDTTVDYFPLLVTREKVLNAGVDINNFEPVSFNELVDNNRKFKELYVNTKEGG